MSIYSVIYAPPASNGGGELAGGTSSCDTHYTHLLTFTPPYYPSKCSESHAEYAPLPRIVYFVGKWAISGHPWATIFMVNEKSFCFLLV